MKLNAMAITGLLLLVLGFFCTGMILSTGPEWNWLLAVQLPAQVAGVLLWVVGINRP